MVVDPDTIDLEVWNYQAQEFVQSYRCKGEYRVRVDVHGPLSNLAAFEVCNRRADGSFDVVDAHNQLVDFQIDYT